MHPSPIPILQLRSQRSRPLELRPSHAWQILPYPAVSGPGAWIRLGSSPPLVLLFCCSHLPSSLSSPISPCSPLFLSPPPLFLLSASPPTPASHRPTPINYHPTLLIYPLYPFIHSAPCPRLINKHLHRPATLPIEANTGRSGPSLCQAWRFVPMSSPYNTPSSPCLLQTVPIFAASVCFLMRPFLAYGE